MNENQFSVASLNSVLFVLAWLPHHKIQKDNLNFKLIHLQNNKTLHKETHPSQFYNICVHFFTLKCLPHGIRTNVTHHHFCVLTMFGLFQDYKMCFLSLYEAFYFDACKSCFPSFLEVLYSDVWESNMAEEGFNPHDYFTLPPNWKDDPETKVIYFVTYFLQINCSL